MSRVKVKSPSMLAHVVLRTNNFKAMVDYYKTFLGAEASYENETLSFLRYDEEHHRIAIIGLPDIPPKVVGSAGLDHTAFTFDTLNDLVLAYRQRKALGILPSRCINHGPTTSMYYTDPDGNRIETQVDNFDTVEEASEFMAGEAFAQNPIGTDFDPEDLIRRLESGESHRSIKNRIESGPRTIH
jgi:catechol-2,3-dioxygenase